MSPPPPGNKALLRDYLPLVFLDKALLGGVTLDCHDDSVFGGALLRDY